MALEEGAALAMRVEITGPAAGIAAGDLAKPVEIGRKSLEVRIDDTFNPYDRKPETFGGNPALGAPGTKGGKRDLKKLSEWLKLMRAMEERKKNGEI